MRLFIGRGHRLRFHFRATWLIFALVDKKQKQRTIIFYKSYFNDFFIKQKQNVKDKIIWTFDLIEELQRVPETYLKHIEGTDGLYEIRIQLGTIFLEYFVFSTKDS
jgi:hypothetical protein